MRVIVSAIALTLLLTTTACEDRRTPTEQAVEWFPASERARARCIVHYESTGNPTATGSAGERGLFQIHPVHRSAFTRLTGKPWSEAYNPVLNGQFAHRLWREQGWSPWTTLRYCR